MTETEISKLRETVLQLWEGSKYLLLVREDLFEYVQNLKMGTGILGQYYPVRIVVKYQIRKYGLAI